MIGILKEIILDSQGAEFETGVPRRVEIRPVYKKATVCIGVRRSGKSTYMHQIIARLLKEGVSPENILYINFFDDRLHDLTAVGLNAVTEAYFSLYPEKKSAEKIYCFFDEIQTINGWEPFVDRLMRTEKSEVYITGSSAKMLSKEIATQMRGRAVSWEMFPFSFQEYLDYKGIAFDGAMAGKKRLLIQKAFDEYWQCGGFPEVLGLDKQLRIKIHQEYFHAVLFRDLVERHDISHPRAVVDLAHQLVNNTASLYTINKLTAAIKSFGHKVPKASVSKYIDWFEDAYFLFSVRLYDASIRRSKANPKKVYCVDHSLVTSISSGILVNSGHLLENLVFIALRRKTEDIFYYRTQSGKEVDFIAKMPDSSKVLLQVCETLSNPKTRKREVSAIEEAMRETGAKEGLIVTRNESEKIELENGTLTVIEAWKFLKIGTGMFG